MEELLQRQRIIAEAIQKISTNIKKDSASRKTTEYIRKRLVSLEELWEEFENNHSKLTLLCDKKHEYIQSGAYLSIKELYSATCALLMDLERTKAHSQPGPSSQGEEEEATRETGMLSKTDELISQQRTNFRAFSRVVTNIDITSISEKWELQDKLQMVQARWNTIDELHWQIDNLLIGSEVDYEQEYEQHECVYEATKRQLNQKLSHTSHQHQAMPKLEIPIFSGNYTQWPTFMDLYSEAIHNNPLISKSQKMQHLKGKLKGEAERLVQHLHISAENYDACWDILTRRYNNTQLLFTKQIQIFLNQPTIHKHSSQELKRLHDTTLETIHAIHNLGIDTTTWDPILVHILTEKMDPETYSSYMESRKAPRDLPSFDEIITFLESKFTALEPVNRKTKSLYTKPEIKDSNDVKEFSSKYLPNKSSYRKFTPKTYHASSERKCPLCKLDHILISCKSFQNMTPEEKINAIRQLKVCENCLYCHNSKQCNSTKTCKVCSNKHHTTLHDALQQKAQHMIPAVNMTPKSAPTFSQHKANHVGGNYNEVLLATVELNIMAMDGMSIKLRALLDQGSQINLITESAAQRLGLHRRKQDAVVSGVGISNNKSHGLVQLNCESIYGNYNFTIEALVMAKLLNNLPNCTFEKQHWPHLEYLNLADPNYNVSRPVDILLDAGVYAEIVMGGILRGPIHAPIAQQTKIGWVLLGNTKTFNCHAALSNLEEISKFWETEEITEQSTTMTSDEQYCETLYATTTKRIADGRYEVRIPMKNCFEDKLGSSRSQAMAQFRQLEKRLDRDEALAESYKVFMADYLRLNHMKQSLIPLEPSYYLPHHGIIKLDSTTTKLRVVFNASNKTTSGRSLNELMECGPNLIQDLQALILRWRGFQYVYSADIEKFYRQIRIQEQDQHLQKVLWRDSTDDKIKDYQLCTVTYGTKAAPFLAMRTIKQLIKDDGKHYPLAAETLDSQLYVDDLLGGSNDIQEAKITQKQLIDLLKLGGFNLRKWASNDLRILEDLSNDQISQNMIDFKNAETNKTLGIMWNPCTDHFTFHHSIQTKKTNEVITKRSLLSELSKLYDPLGWLSPATIKAKLIFQQLWTTNTSWDDPVPEHIQNEWEVFRNDLKYISQISIPRWIGNTQKPIELHGFCDASEKAYSCVIYCRSAKEDGQYMTRVVAGKTKLAPIKKLVTLPRLELCGAYLLSRLMKKVIESLNKQTVTIHGWTDSMVVLGWLHGDVSRWKTFVANRATQITNIMPSSCWKHVKSEENPADCASRGLLPSQLIKHNLWWEAPKWLSENNIPHHQTDYKAPTLEQKSKKLACATRTSTLIIEELLRNNNTITRVLRILSWILRVNKNKGEARQPYLTTAELENAHNAVIKFVQNKHFANDIAHLLKTGKVHVKSSLLNLNPFLDDQGLLRVGGRLTESDLKISQKYPIILPHKDRLTELLINQSHITTLHGGARLTLTHLRNKYWILRGVKTVKGHIIKCIRCHRFKMSTNKQLMGDLTKPRVTPSRPFTHTGVDFTGYVDVKANKGRGIKTTKAYIAIFVCLATKAIHLDLVSDLSTAAFLNAFKRFCARRGTPKSMYSDNGTNFVGAAKTLSQEHKEALKYYINEELLSELANLGIEWNFNAPLWPSAGGLWEAAVKSMKFHLKRVIGEQKLTFEEFSTLIAQIEACLNSRPLIPLTNDIDDLDCLTPAHFLVGGPLLSSPLSPDVDIRNITTRWQLLEKMHKDFWKRWSSEYLQTLQTRSKWHCPTKNIETDDIVLVKDDHLPPSKWLLGRVIETHPGKDGHVRVVTLKTKNGTLKRPIIKLSRLPIEQNEGSAESEEDQATASEKRTHETLKRKKPAKKSLNTYVCTFFTFICCITTSLQQAAINVTTLSSAKLIYFDKIADMQIRQDDWKMVVYYNMTTYWRSLQNIEDYVSHLNSLSKEESALTSIASQLEHEIKEIRYYNDVLRSEHGARTRRGLINGIGYAANYLFGVLDENFAQKYDKDINLIQTNENHLLNLYKEQTSIIEGEYNILKRNEDVMNKQFTLINKQFQETNERIKLERNNALNMMSSALAANLIISNIRRVQQLLLDLVTDVKDGRVDAHLLKPNQLQDQLNVISGQLPNELSLPCTNSHQCIRQMYKLSRVHVKLTRDFFIFEVKLPLVNNEQYELNRVIPIPYIQGQTEKHVIPTSEYLAINLKKDMMMPLTYEDLSACVQLKTHLLLCALGLPIYDIKQAATICEAQIINNKNLSACRTTISSCKDKWIQLHNDGAWLYSCCKQCLTRIFCPSGTSSRQLSATGIIELESGCMLKGDNIIIRSHNNFHSELNVNEEEQCLRESSINHFITDNNYSFEDEHHEVIMKTLKTRIEQVKEHQDTLHEVVLSHNTHRYILYSVILVAVGGTVLWIALKLKARYCAVLRITEGPHSSPQDRSISEPQSRTRERASCVVKVDRATSPASSC